MALHTLLALTAALLVATPLATAQGNSAPAPRGNGKSRVTQERTRSVYGYGYIDGGETYTATCYDYEDYSQYECQQPCTTTSIDVSDYTDASGKPTPGELRVFVSQCTIGEPECGGDEADCEVYEYGDYEYRYCPSTCYYGCAMAEDAYTFAANRKSGTVDFSTELAECDYDYSADGENPLIGTTVASTANVKCAKPDRQLNSCRYRTLGSNRADRYSYAYTYFSASCSAQDVPFIAVGGKRTTYDFLSFGSTRYRNRG